MRLLEKNELITTEQSLNKSISLLQSQLKKKYYVYQLTQQLWNREFCLIKPKPYKNVMLVEAIRFLKVNNDKGFNYIMNEMVAYDVTKRPMNMYYSLAKYRQGLDYTGNDLKKRGSAIELWKEKQVSEMISYDCLIDIDAPLHNNSYMEAAKTVCENVMEFLDVNNVPYHLRFSGMGYHLVIPYDYFKTINQHFEPHGETTEELQSSIYYLYNEITRRLNEEFGEMVDKDLHDYMRVTKLPYSLVHYNSGVYIAWEFFSKEEFEDHNYIDYKVYGDCHFKGETQIYNRGLHLFNETGNNPKKFLTTLGVYN